MHEKSILSNGLRVFTSAMPHTRSVSMMVCLRSAPRYERDSEAGISHFVEHLCFKGTKRRPSSTELCETIERVGGIINGGTDKESTVYWIKVARSNFPLALDVLSDMVQHPLFAQNDVEKERQIILEEIKMTNDSPQQRVDLLIDELIWPDQPLGRDIAGSVDTVRSLSLETMAGYWKRHYTADNAVVSVAGDVEHAEVVGQLADGFAHWGGEGKRDGTAAQNQQEAPRFHLEYRDTEQVHLALAVRGLSAVDPNRFALDLVNVALGEGMSSRLFVGVREKRGLAYDVHSYISRFLDSGAMIIYAGVDPSRVEDALLAVLDELARLREPLPEAELNKAKEMIKGHLLLGLEDSRAVASWVGRQELLLGRILTVDDIIAAVDAVTSADTGRVAQELLVSEKLSLAVVGPIKEESRISKLLHL
ncbi:MAG: peptidase domain protein [Dehalococcoidia bacterium]|nr:peptidase domain protein [Dehalococcoidia bacterium]